jgi:hypothetical protein
MAKSLFTENDRKVIISRIQKLTPQSERRWGKMNVRQMLQHIAEPIRTAMGEFPAVLKGNPFFRSAFGKFLIIYVMPWPKGKAPTAPEYDQVLKQNPGLEFEPGRTNLLRTIEQFSKLRSDFKLGIHPAFENLTYKQWGDLMHKHIDHHLKQFGV